MIEQSKKHIANTYSREDIALVSGKDSRCIDENGKEYIDFTSGIGVNSLGFSNTDWVTAVSAQLGKLNHTSNLYYTQPQAQLAQILCEKTGMKKVFFANSGAEANEGAIKAARKYSSDKYSKERYEIITLENSFHGRTIATLAATGQDVFHKNFSPFPAGFSHALANDLEDLKAKITPKTCGIFLECIQGEGGVVPLDLDYVKAVEALCKAQDILLMVDEVQTGVGRTGTFLCSEQYGILPDLVTLAKGLGGGLPIGAILFGEKTQNTLGQGEHATTFGGNPIVCAGGVSVVEKMDAQFLAEVARKGELLKKELSVLAGVISCSGKGLMIGISLSCELQAKEILKLCAQKGLLVLTAKEKLRLLPPLNTTDSDLLEGVARLAQVLNEVSR